MKQSSALLLLAIMTFAGEPQALAFEAAGRPMQLASLNIGDVHPLQGLPPDGAHELPQPQDHFDDVDARLPEDAILKPSAGIAAAIKTASEATGVNFDYLLKTAACESGFRAEVNARNSSATGLFQFLESTWLTLIKRVGPQFGLQDLADDIVQSPVGQSEVADAQRRQAILDLRRNPKVSAMIAAALARKNARFLTRRLGREPNDGELYIAHFLGPTGAARLIRLALSRPDARAHIHFARAAGVNRSIYYEGPRARTIAEVYAHLVNKHRDILTGKSDTAAMPRPAPPLPNRRPKPSDGDGLIQVAAPR